MSNDNDAAPMEEIECYGGHKIRRLAITPEGLEWLRNYVRGKLEASGIPKEEANPQNPHSIAAEIVHLAWRQPDSIKHADMLIELEIRFPPDPITHQRFSLRAFIKKTKQ